MSSFHELLYPPISQAVFNAVHSSEPKRICFGSTHRNALKRAMKGPAVGFFNIPFTESISAFFPWQLFPAKGKYGGYARTIFSESEYLEIERWISARTDLVFIRSALTSAVAACEHYTDNGRSPIGELEKSAKYDGSQDARTKLTVILAEVFGQLHETGSVDGVIAVPPSKAGGDSLPSLIAAGLLASWAFPTLAAPLVGMDRRDPLKNLT